MKQVIPTVIIPLIHNEQFEYYWHLSRTAVDSIFYQTERPDLILSIEDTLAKAKNRGVERADTEWCMFLDADDELGKDFIEKLYVKGDSVGLLKPQVYLNGKLWDFRVANLMTSNFLINGCVFKKDIYEAVGGTEERTFEDWHLWAKMDVDSTYHYHKSSTGLNSQATQQDISDVKHDIEEYMRDHGNTDNNLTPKMYNA